MATVHAMANGLNHEGEGRYLGNCLLTNCDLPSVFTSLHDCCTALVLKKS